jgi:hypothetical protein
VYWNDVLYGKKIKRVFTGQPAAIAQADDEQWYSWGVNAVCSNTSATYYTPVPFNFGKPIQDIMFLGGSYVILSEKKMYTCLNGSMSLIDFYDSKDVHSVSRTLYQGFYFTTAEGVMLIASTGLRITPYITPKPFHITPVAGIESGLIKLGMFSSAFGVLDVHHVMVWLIGVNSRLIVIFKNGECVYGELGVIQPCGYTVDTNLTTTIMAGTLVTTNGTVYVNWNTKVMEIPLLGNVVQKILYLSETPLGVTGVFASCTSYFTGTNCDIPICYDKAANHPEACGGPNQGTCVAPNDCKCTKDFFNLDCRSKRCTEFAKGDDCNVLTALSIVLLTLAVAGSLLILSVIIAVMTFCTTRYRKVVVKQEKAEEEMKQMLEESLLRADSLAEQVDRDWVIPFSDIKFLERLSEGSFGVVMKGRYQNADV